MDSRTQPLAKRILAGPGSDGSAAAHSIHAASFALGATSSPYAFSSVRLKSASNFPKSTNDASSDSASARAASVNPARAKKA
jgi:hypothetical protein